MTDMFSKRLVSGTAVSLLGLESPVGQGDEEEYCPAVRADSEEDMLNMEDRVVEKGQI